MSSSTISAVAKSMGVCTISRTTYKRGNRNVTKITFTRTDGTTAGSISYSTAAKQQKKKRLQYNFKQISNLLMMTKTSTSAGRVVTKALANVAMLQKKLKNGEYDETEVASAIIHAKKLERIARKRMKHLKEEESVKQKGSCTEDMEQYEEDESGAERTDTEREQEISREELKELIREYRELMEEMQEELDDVSGLDELSDALMGTFQSHMDSDDLERLKKKHRSDEMREIVEADMKYLKDLFARLEREKQAASSGVSLQLSGTEMPVQVTEVPVMTEGGSIDLSV